MTFNHSILIAEYKKTRVSKERSNTPNKEQTNAPTARNDQLLHSKAANIVL